MEEEVNDIFTLIENGQLSEVENSIQDDVYVLEERNENGLTPFLYCCEKGQKRAVERILQIRKSSLRDTSTKKETCLHCAIRSNKEELVYFLLDQDGIQKEAQDNEGYTPLHIAVMSKKYSIVSELIKRGCDVNATTFEGDSSLHIAAKANGPEIITLLMNRKADPSLKNAREETPLMIANKLKYMECVDALIHVKQLDEDLNKQDQPSAQNKQEEKESKKTPKLKPKKKNINRYQGFQIPGVSSEDVQKLKAAQLDALMTYIKNKETDKAIKSIRSNNGIINEIHNGSYPILLAAEFGNQKIIRSLVHQGANIETTLEGKTPLLVATESDKADIAKVLVQLGARTDVRDDKGRSLLAVAYSKRSIDLIQLFRSLDLDKEDPSVLEALESNDNQFREACKRLDCAEALSLIKLHTSLAHEVVDEATGMYPIHYAAQMDCSDLLVFLFSQSVDLLAPDKRGRSALDVATPELADMFIIYMEEEESNEGKTAYSYSYEYSGLSEYNLSSTAEDSGGEVPRIVLKKEKIEDIDTKEAETENQNQNKENENVVERKGIFNLKRLKKLGFIIEKRLRQDKEEETGVTLPQDNDMPYQPTIGVPDADESKQSQPRKIPQFEQMRRKQLQYENMPNYTEIKPRKEEDFAAEPKKPVLLDPIKPRREEPVKVPELREQVYRPSKAPQEPVVHRMAPKFHPPQGAEVVHKMAPKPSAEAIESDKDYDGYLSSVTDTYDASDYDRPLYRTFANDGKMDSYSMPEDSSPSKHLSDGPVVEEMPPDFVIPSDPEGRPDWMNGEAPPDWRDGLSSYSENSEASAKRRADDGFDDHISAGDSSLNFSSFQYGHSATGESTNEGADYDYDYSDDDESAPQFDDTKNLFATVISSMDSQKFDAMDTLNSTDIFDPNEFASLSSKSTISEKYSSDVLLSSDRYSSDNRFLLSSDSHPSSEHGKEENDESEEQRIIQENIQSDSNPAFIFRAAEDSYSSLAPRYRKDNQATEDYYYDSGIEASRKLIIDKKESDDALNSVVSSEDSQPPAEPKNSASSAAKTSSEPRKATSSDSKKTEYYDSSSDSDVSDTLQERFTFTLAPVVLNTERLSTPSTNTTTSSSDKKTSSDVRTSTDEELFDEIGNNITKEKRRVRTSTSNSISTSISTSGSRSDSDRPSKFDDFFGSTFVSNFGIKNPSTSPSMSASTDSATSSDDEIGLKAMTRRVTRKLEEQRRILMNAENIDSVEIDLDISISEQSSSVEKAVIKNNNDFKTVLTCLYQHNTAMALDVIEANPHLAAEVSPFHNTLLHHAAHLGNSRVVAALISAGADVEFKSQRGSTALLFATDAGSLTTVQTLLENGADPYTFNERGKTASMIALERQYKDIVLELRSYINPTWKGENEKLIDAIEKSNYDLVVELCRKGADVNMPDTSGVPPLHYSISKDVDFRIFQFLLGRISNVNAQDSAGQTAAIVAVRKRLVRHLSYLMMRQTNVNLPDQRGKSAICYAKELRLGKLVKYLEKNNVR